jgi:hypothetical protein
LIFLGKIIGTFPEGGAVGRWGTILYAICANGAPVLPGFLFLSLKIGKTLDKFGKWRYYALAFI